jgi:hypothetical protein
LNAQVVEKRPSQDTSNELFDFYEYVIDKYVWLIQTVIEGNCPFMVTVQDLYCDTIHNRLRIDISYTKSYEELSSLSNAHLYKYDDCDSIYIILQKFQGQGEAFILSNQNTEPFTQTILQETLYPLTDDYSFYSSFPRLTPENSTINFTKKDKYSILKIKNRVTAQKNGYDIVFFTDYKSKGD